MDSNFRSENHSQRGSSAMNQQLPFLLLVSALAIWFSFQLFQAIKMRDGLIQGFETQESQFQNANKLRKSLAALATGTKQLANQGNSNASQIVNALAQRGVKITDTQPSQTQPPPQSQQ